MRYGAFEGSFYPGNKEELKKLISSVLSRASIDKSIARKAVSFVAPHAGYIYSGFVAAHTYLALSISKAKNADAYVIIGPNHTGYGTPISVSTEDWRTPLGVVRNDIELSKAIASSPYTSIDEEAHAFEHSVEVQLPFLQSVVDAPKCVFICMGDQSVRASELLASALLDSAKKLNRSIAVIASSDFNHYESANIAKKKDLPAIEALENLDYKAFNARLREANDTACGYGPITVASIVAMEMGASSGYLLKYATSGDATGDYSSVVAYASIAFA